MAYRLRRRRRGTRRFVSGAIRRYALGILFILLGAFIVGVIGYVSGLVPDTTLAVGDLNISNRLIINFIAWVGGIVFVIQGMRKFGLSI